MTRQQNDFQCLQSKELIYSDEYKRILSEAKRWTLRENAVLTTTRHLFWAAANLFPQVFEDMLGRSLFLPDLETSTQEGASPGEKARKMRASSEFERILSPYGGGLAEPVAALSIEEPIGAVHVVAALLLDAKRDVADFLRRNGIEIEGAKRSVREYLKRLTAANECCLRRRNDVKKRV